MRAVFSSVTATSGAGEGADTGRQQAFPGPGDNLLRYQPLLPFGEFGPGHHRRPTEATSPAIFTTIQPEPLVFSGRAA